jgi:cytochrome c-type biogenesis protein CcmH
MIAFWILAALVSAAAATLIIQRAARGARAGVGEDPSLAVYRRQLSEIDDLAERGLLPDTERRSAHAEAARRLLAAAENAPPTLSPPARGGRLPIVVVAALAPLVALCVYLVVGSPQTPDQPYARRVGEWRKADPSTLDPNQLVAVLQTLVTEKPKDPRGYYFLARAQLAVGDSFSASRSMQKAVALAPGQAELWASLGEVRLDPTTGVPDADATAAFRHALQLDPKAAAPRYFLARGKIAAGDVDGGLADWRVLEAGLKPDDPKRQGLEQEIAEVGRTRALPQPQTPQPAAPAAQGQQAFIQSMVSGLAARLQANPDDPAGWARLIRAYAVLGDAPKHDAALARAKALFKDRPNDLRLVEQASVAPQ